MLFGGASGRVTMDFIEQWLHLSPDGGSGALEAYYAAATAAGVILLFRHALATFLTSGIPAIRLKRH
jgi:hypothetical protein